MASFKHQLERRALRNGWVVDPIKIGELLGQVLDGACEKHETMRTKIAALRSLDHVRRTTLGVMGEQPPTHIKIEYVDSDPPLAPPLDSPASDNPGPPSSHDSGDGAESG